MQKSLKINDQELEHQLAALKHMPMAELKQIWRSYFNEEPSSRNKATLVFKLSYHLQKLAYGRLKPETLDFLRNKKIPAKAKRKLTRPIIGTEFVREYQGARHVVVAVQGGYTYDGQIYKSLSAIARHITGTNWNGNLFFGLVTRG